MDKKKIIEYLKKEYIGGTLSVAIPINEETLPLILKKNLAYLNHVEQTEELILGLIAKKLNKHDNFLQYVHKQTHKICLAAVTYNYKNLIDVIDQTNDICLAAIRKNPLALEFVHQQTEEMCILAVSISSECLKYVRVQTESVIDAVFESKNLSLESYLKIINQTDRIKWKILHQHVQCLYLVRQPNEEMVLFALKKTLSSARFYSGPITKNIALFYAKQNNHLIENIPVGLLENSVYEEIVSKNGLLLRYCRQRTPEIERLAVKNNWRALIHVSEFTEGVCVSAYEQDIRAIRILWPTYFSPMMKRTPLASMLTVHANSLTDRDHMLTEIENSSEFDAELNAFDTQRKMEIQLNKNSPNANTPSRRKLDLF